MEQIIKIAEDVFKKIRNNREMLIEFIWTFGNSRTDVKKLIKLLEE